MRPASKRTLEGMRMSVGHAGDRDPVEAHRVRGRNLDPGLDPDDPLAFDLDRNPRGSGLTTQPRKLAPVRAHEPARSTIARARASKSTRWLRSNCSQVASVRASARSTKRTPSR